MDTKQDSAVGRLEQILGDSNSIAEDLQPHMKQFIGQPINEKLATDAVGAMYDSHNGAPPFIAQIAKYLKLDVEKGGLDYEQMLAQHGITREQLKKLVLESGSTFNANTISAVVSNLASRYSARSLEAEPARIENEASKRSSVEYGVNVLRELIGTTGGKPAQIAANTRLAAIKTYDQLRGALTDFYSNAFSTWRQATGGATAREYQPATAGAGAPAHQ